jgi:hypothetical protein
MGDWSFGLFLLPVFVLLFIVCVLATLWFLCGSDPYGDNGLAAFLFAAAAMFILVCCTLGYYPYQGDYHTWSTKDGTVLQITSRFVGSGDGTQQKYAVQLDDGNVYGCLDTRCSLVKAGDYLKLSCKKAYEFRSTSGWDCRFRDWREA